MNNKLLKIIEKRLNINIVNFKLPPQGMGSEVFFVNTDLGNEYAVEMSGMENNDANVLKILQKFQINIAVPKLIDSFIFDNNAVVIMEKISAKLLEDIDQKQMHNYIPSMIRNLKKLHFVKSNQAGYINSNQKYKYWQEFLLSIFNNKNGNLDWTEISIRKNLNTKLVLNSIKNILNIISKTEFINSNYALLHSDFNQRNLFVKEESNELAAIIDWGEAMYGDPVYDFARIRMFIWHFDLGNKVIEDYYKLMNYNSQEKSLDMLYWLTRIIEYLAYYSEDLSTFNLSRIKLHQEFLQNFDWDSFNKYY